MGAMDELYEAEKTAYREYLDTPQWSAIREMALDRAGYHCALCNSSVNLNVHHKDYSHLGCERDSDVIVLCHRCHCRHHGVLVEET